jgi:hypothetical protein
MVACVMLRTSVSSIVVISAECADHLLGLDTSVVAGQPFIKVMQAT